MAMSKSERKARHAELYAALLRHDISKWGDRFLKALNPSDKKSALSVDTLPLSTIAQPVSGGVKGSAATDPTRPPATRQ
jgi:hypothetical protein